MELIADDYFLIAHDEQTGKIRIQERVAGIGMASALLGELVLAGNLRVTHGKVSVQHAAPPGDDLAERVLEQIGSETRHEEVRTWLQFLGQGAANRIGNRLTRAGYLTPVRRRRLTGSVVRYVSVDLNLSGRPAMRLNTQIGRGLPATMADAMLTGVVAATGLSRRVWWDNDSLVSHHVQTTVASLPMSLRELLAHTEAAVGDAVLGTNM